METACTELKGVGKKVAEKLAAINLKTLQDLLFHLPIRYEDRTKITPIREAKIDEFAVVEGRVIQGGEHYGKRKSFICTIQDSSGILNIRLFYFNSYQVKALATPNIKLRCFGLIRFFGSSREMVHPEYHIISDENTVPLEKNLSPIYPVAEGITQGLIKKIIKQALTTCINESLEILPKQILDELQMTSIDKALQILHMPEVNSDLSLPIKRLAFEELLSHHLIMKQLRSQIQENYSYSIEGDGELILKLKQLLPYTLTQAQTRVTNEIVQDLAKNQPMMRLLQGDVGSGKTVVALMAAMSVVESGKQVVLMAPTEILAEQHYHNFKLWCDPLNVTLSYLSGSTKAKERRSELENILSGKTNIIIGTHALFQDDVIYYNLALVIIDEQHRFGVHQRLALYNKGKNNDKVPHQLIMTATPIPRSLAMTAYADLDCSVIDELPHGRTPVLTVSVDNQRRDEVIERIKLAKENNQQVYWVCTLIEESDILQCQAAEITAQYLIKMLPDFRIALIHGRMKHAEKEAVMSSFKNGEQDILVATTVIEVGVDVPNASLMIIENAERMGLSQLHQLRGRVGRGAIKSYCLLLYQNPLTEQARKRIQIMRETNDGFEVARQDLMMRGPGELLGTKQAGEINFKIADLIRDQSLLPQVHKAASMVIAGYPLLAEKIIRRWKVTATDYLEV